MVQLLHFLTPQSAVILLSFEYYKTTNDISFFTERWKSAMRTTMDVMQEQQQGSLEEEDHPTYHHERK